ncbi:GNAT family N-acetyltransferase [Streptomyces sp. NRRL B-3648]|uniref:GNAT family N-acetyltransferase n=1 Tax=Streptomyces sp. NRRL B-3648 TaxID=1519493 RepID=UPI003B6392C7
MWPAPAEADTAATAHQGSGLAARVGPASARPLRAVGPRGPRRPAPRRPGSAPGALPRRTDPHHPAVLARIRTDPANGRERAGGGASSFISGPAEGTTCSLPPCRTVPCWPGRPTAGGASPTSRTCTPPLVCPWIRRPCHARRDGSTCAAAVPCRPWATGSDITAPGPARNFFPPTTCCRTCTDHAAALRLPTVNAADLSLPWRQILKECAHVTFIATLTLDGQAVAAQLCLHCRDRAYSLITAMDPAHRETRACAAALAVRRPDGRGLHGTGPRPHDGTGRPALLHGPPLRHVDAPPHLHRCLRQPPSREVHRAGRCGGPTVIPLLALPRPPCLTCP